MTEAGGALISTCWRVLCGRFLPGLAESIGHFSLPRTVTKVNIVCSSLYKSPGPGSLTYLSYVPSHLDSRVPPSQPPSPRLTRHDDPRLSCSCCNRWSGGPRQHTPGPTRPHMPPLPSATPPPSLVPRLRSLVTTSPARLALAAASVAAATPPPPRNACLHNSV